MLFGRTIDEISFVSEVIANTTSILFENIRAPSSKRAPCYFIDISKFCRLNGMFVWDVDACSIFKYGMRWCKTKVHAIQYRKSLKKLFIVCYKLKTCLMNISLIKYLNLSLETLIWILKQRSGVIYSSLTPPTFTKYVPSSLSPFHFDTKRRFHFFLPEKREKKIKKKNYKKILNKLLSFNIFLINFLNCCYPGGREDTQTSESCRDNVIHCCTEIRAH